MTLAPRWQRPGALDDLRDRWAKTGAVRVEPAFPEARAVDFLGGLRAAEYAAVQDLDPVDGYQLWRFGWVPEVACDHPLCELSRWLRDDGVAWVRALTGLPLQPATDPMLSADRADKSSFFEAYDDSGDGRAVAFQIHFTTASWPAHWGGHLEVLDRRDGRVVERWAPTWNAIDLFDVRQAGAWRRMPMIQKHLEGYTVAGWFYTP